MTGTITHEPLWCVNIRKLIADLHITQAALADRLGVSPATVSRWMRGKIEPTAEGYVALGKLAPVSTADFFYERAGLDPAVLSSTSENRLTTSLRLHLQNLNLETQSPAEGKGFSSPEAAAIPLLKVRASITPEPAQNLSFASADMEGTVIVPSSWCPHPDHTIGMRLADDSMEPLIPMHSIVFVDSAETTRNLAYGAIVVMCHRELGFRIGRLQRYGGADFLIFANSQSPALNVNPSFKWGLAGRVLWWIGTTEDLPPRSHPGAVEAKEIDRS